MLNFTPTQTSVVDLAGTKTQSFTQSVSEDKERTASVPNFEEHLSRLETPVEKKPIEERQARVDKDDLLPEEIDPEIESENSEDFLPDEQSQAESETPRAELKFGEMQTTVAIKGERQSVEVATRLTGNLKFEQKIEEPDNQVSKQGEVATEPKSNLFRSSGSENLEFKPQVVSNRLDQVKPPVSSPLISDGQKLDQALRKTNPETDREGTEKSSVASTSRVPDTVPELKIISNVRSEIGKPAFSQHSSLGLGNAYDPAGAKERIESFSQANFETAENVQPPNAREIVAGNSFSSTPSQPVKLAEVQVQQNPTIEKNGPLKDISKDQARKLSDPLSAQLNSNLNTNGKTAPTQGPQNPNNVGQISLGKKIQSKPTPGSTAAPFELYASQTTQHQTVSQANNAYSPAVQSSAQQVAQPIAAPNMLQNEEQSLRFTDQTRLLEADFEMFHRSEPATQTRNVQAQTVGAPELPRHVAQQIAFVMRGGSNPVTELALNPAELGSVRISLSAAESGVIVTIQADRSETLDLMRRNADQLAQEFLDIGYGSAEFNFSQNSGEQLPDEDSPTEIGKSGDFEAAGQTPNLNGVNRIATDRVDIRL